MCCLLLCFQLQCSNVQALSLKVHKNQAASCRIVQDKQRILEGCCRILPSLRDAEIISDWAGLRPYREPLRVELEQVSLMGGSQRLPVVHNYGHGGSGLTLGWGTAGDAIALVKVALQRSGPSPRL